MDRPRVEFVNCPVCDGVLPAAREKVKDMYGRIPMRDFIKEYIHLEEIRKPVSVRIEEETTLTKEGFDIRITGKCSICGAEWFLRR